MSYKQQIYIFHSSGSWKSKVKVPAFSGSVFGEGLHLVFKKQYSRAFLVDHCLKTINAGEGVEKREPFSTVDENANQYSHYGEECGDSLKIWNYDPEIPLLGIHTKKTRIERNTCTPTFTAALFTITRTWKQPRCLLADKWIKQWWYIYTTEYYSAIKKNTFESVIMRQMKLEPIIQSEVNHKEKHQYSILTHIYGIQKDGNNDPIGKTTKETQM